MKKIFLLLLMIGLTFNVYATHYWIDIDAADTSGTGLTKWSPYKYIAQIPANRTWASGDVVHIMPGSYDMNADYAYSDTTDYFQFPSGTSGITIIGEEVIESERIIIYFSKSGANQRASVDANGITFKNLVIKDILGSGTYFIENTYGDLTFKECVIYNTSSNVLIKDDEGSSALTISFFDCQFYDANYYLITNVNGSNTTIRFNHCTLDDISAIFYGSPQSSCASVSLENCTLYNLKITYDATADVTLNYCVYSSVTDYADFSWTNSYNGDPLLTWEGSPYYRIKVSSSSPVIDAGNDGLDVGHLSRIGLE